MLCLYLPGENKLPVIVLASEVPTPDSGSASDYAYDAHQTDMMAFGHILCPDAVPAEGSRAKCEDRALLCHPVTQCRQPLFSLLHGDHRLSFPQFMRQVTCIFFVELGFPVGRAHQEPTDDGQSMISGRDSKET